MKVNILTGTRFHSGLVANILSNRNHSVSIYSSSPRSKWIFANEEYVTLIFVPLFSGIFSYLTKIPSSVFFKEISTVLFDIFSLIVMKRSDVLHSWSSYGLFSIKRFKKNNTIIFVEKSCPHPFFQESLLRKEAKFLGVKHHEHSKWFINRVLKEFELADKIVVCSNYTLNSFLENGFPKDKLYNVTLDANFKVKRSYNRDFSKEEFVVGSAGGNVLRKGFYYLLEAWAEMHLPNAKLLLKAPKSQLIKIPKIWALINSCDNIEVVGYLNDIEDFYARCDLFVLPSIDEGFGMVVFEALACSLPVIITKNVGAGDFITNENEGYIIDIRNPQQIKEKILYLYNNRQLMKRMSINAKKTYDSYKTAGDSYQNRVLGLYEKYKK